MKNNMFRVISLMLAAMMLVLSLVSCGAETADTADTSATTTSEDAADSNGGEQGTPDSTEADTGHKDELVINEKTYYGADYNVLVSGNANYNLYYGSDFYYEDSSADNISYARAKWIAGIEKKFDIKIVETRKVQFNDATGSGQGFQTVQNSVLSESGDFDSCMIGTFDAANLARNLYLSDLNSLEYINLENSWWDQHANRDLTINGKMYYTTGDISTIDNVFTTCILFNKDMVLENKLTSPYEYVKNNTWTMDTYITMIKQAAKTSGEGISDTDKVYGLLTWNDALLHILSAADERVANVTDDGKIEFSLYNERSQQAFALYHDISKNNAYSINYQADLEGDWDMNRNRLFAENKALFYNTLFEAISFHRDGSTDFGVIPYPKLNEDQQTYGHLVSAWHSEVFCIPAIVMDIDYSSSVSEYMAYLGQQETKPAYYDDTLIGKYIRDEESIEMLDTIFATRVFDIGVYYKLGNIVSDIEKIAQKRSTSSFRQVYNANASIAQSQLESLMDDFARAD